MLNYWLVAPVLVVIGVDPEADPEADPEVDPEADPEADLGNDPGNDPGADPGADLGADPVADPHLDRHPEQWELISANMTIFELVCDLQRDKEIILNTTLNLLPLLKAVLVWDPLFWRISPMKSSKFQHLFKSMRCPLSLPEKI